MVLQHLALIRDPRVPLPDLADQVLVGPFLPVPALIAHVGEDAYLLRLAQQTDRQLVTSQEVLKAISVCVLRLTERGPVPAFPFTGRIRSAAELDGRRIPAQP